MVTADIRPGALRTSSRPQWRNVRTWSSPWGSLRAVATNAWGAVLGSARSLGTAYRSRSAPPTHRNAPSPARRALGTIAPDVLPPRAAVPPRVGGGALGGPPPPPAPPRAV